MKKNKKTMKTTKMTKNRKTKNRKTRNRNRKNKTMIIKGGNNPFSGFSGLWGTMNYNLSNAISQFTIAPPSSPLNPSDRVINPSHGKQDV